MSQRKARIVVVEDHPMFRERLAQVIDGEEDLELVGVAESVEDALRVIRLTEPDLALIDVSLKGASGLVLIRELKAVGLDVAALVLSMHQENLYAERAMRAGARGYITKHRASSEVLFAIRRVLAGGVYLSHEPASPLSQDFRGRSEPRPPNSVGRLTEREREVFRWIGRGRTTREIAQEMQLGIASIDTYRARIKEKLRLRNATELQHSAMRWVLESGQE